LQFQLTVNIVALILVFVGAAAGFGQPLTAVQMLWVNLVMDTMGALALGTEKPTLALLDRKPYKRTASLISRPMMRNMAFQAAWQLSTLFTMLFLGAKWFNLHDMSMNPCFKYGMSDDTSTTFTIPGTSTKVGCDEFKTICGNDMDTDCLVAAGFDKIDSFAATCLTCDDTNRDYTHGTIIFNAFIWCQIFNEYNARSILNDVNIFAGITQSSMFAMVSAFSVASQWLIVTFGGSFTSTSPLTLEQWLYTVLMGAISLVVGVIMRFCPIGSEEDPATFFLVDDEVVQLDAKATGDVEMKPL